MKASKAFQSKIDHNTLFLFSGSPMMSHYPKPRLKQGKKIIMYIHYDTENDWFSLHDCHAEKIVFEKDTLSFYFSRGFWVLDTHPRNGFNATVRSDASRVDYHMSEKMLDALGVSIFTKTKSRKAFKEKWAPRDFIQAVNKGLFSVEFIEEYRNKESLTFKCWIWFGKEPQHKECELSLYTDKVTYCWNKLCPESVW